MHMKKISKITEKFYTLLMNASLLVLNPDKQFCVCKIDDFHNFKFLHGQFLTLGPLYLPNGTD